MAVHCLSFQKRNSFNEFAHYANTPNRTGTVASDVYVIQAQGSAHMTAVTAPVLLPTRNKFATILRGVPGSIMHGRTVMLAQHQKCLRPSSAVHEQ